MTRLVLVSLLVLKLQVSAAPLCHHGDGSCHVPSLSDLFDRLGLQSSRIQHISSDLHSHLIDTSVSSGQERRFPPSKNLIWGRKCHTHHILTPRDKEEAQTLGRERLMDAVLRLLVAWEAPLAHLHRDLWQEHLSAVKVLEVVEMMQELKVGVTRMKERMMLLGELSNTVGFLTSGLAPSSSSYLQGPEHLDHNDLLLCFRRDASKVQNYLRVLKCSTLPEPDC